MGMPKATTYGHQVRSARLRAGLSVRQLGALLGISFSTLARLERGDGGSMPHTRRQVAQWLDPTGAVPPCQCVRCAGPSRDCYALLAARVARLEQQVCALTRSPQERGTPDGSA